MSASEGDAEQRERIDGYVAAGLLDSDRADAPDPSDTDRRLALLEYLSGLGLSIPEIAQADANHQLLTIGAFRALRPGEERLTISDVATAVGLEAATAMRFWRACGFPDPRPLERRFSDHDVELFALFATLCELTDIDRALHYARTLGEAITQVAEAEIALARANIEAPLADVRDWASIARGYVDFATEVFARIAGSIDTLHRHHLEAIGRRYSEASLPASATNVVDLVVGFADLAGYTSLSQSLDAHRLVALLEVFEAITGDLIAAAGASVVKRVGDGVMFVTPAPGVACELALDILDAVSREARLPRVRVGMALGEVIVRQGDFHGPVVNLAARLAGAADPGVVLVAEAFGARLGSHAGRFVFTPSGRLQLAGYEEPVLALQLLRS